MWVASRAFRYRGNSYAVGDTVPAEEWRNRVALSKMHRIKFVADPPPPPVNYHTLNRDDLNAYALENGIDDPTSYKKKDELLAALDELAESSTTDDGSTKDATQPPANSVDASSEDAPLIPVEDDLFAGLDDPVVPETKETDEESTEDDEGETDEPSATI